MGVTTGYLTYDLIVVLLYLDRNISTIIHHEITSPFMWWLQFGYPIYAAIGMLSEISTPFLNQGWFQIKSGKQVNSFTKYGLLTTYFVFRVLLFPYIFIMSLVKEEYYAAPLCFVLALLNFIWLCKLIKLSKNNDNINSEQPINNFDEESNMHSVRSRKDD